MTQDLIDIDGYTKDTHFVGVLGGWLGQLMICFNTIAKHFAWADGGRKAPNRSHRSTPKSARSVKSAGSEKSGKSTKSTTRHIINDQQVQQFIFRYIQDHLKTEKLWMHVSAEFEKFLVELP